MKKRKKIIIEIIWITMIVLIATIGYRHVNSVKSDLEDVQIDLLYIEADRMSSEEATHLKSVSLGSFESSDAVHPESAYVLAIPYIVIDFVLIIVYIVKYRT